MAVYSAVLQLVAAVSSITFVLQRTPNESEPRRAKRSSVHPTGGTPGHSWHTRIFTLDHGDCRPHRGQDRFVHGKLVRWSGRFADWCLSASRAHPRERKSRIRRRTDASARDQASRPRERLSTAALPRFRSSRLWRGEVRTPPIGAVVGRPRQPRDRPPIDPQPAGDLALRDPVSGQRPDLRPLQRAAHLPSPPVLDDVADREGGHGRHHPRPDSGALFTS
jgi:hypothetical protein